MTNSETNLIEADGLCKIWGDVTAVSPLSFSVKAGEVVGFLGPNGAGKSTTMRMLTTFLPPTAGTARIGGHDVVTDAPGVRRLIGYLPAAALRRDADRGLPPFRRRTQGR